MNTLHTWGTRGKQARMGFWNMRRDRLDQTRLVSCLVLQVHLSGVARVPLLKQLHMLKGLATLAFCSNISLQQLDA